MRSFASSFISLSACIVRNSYIPFKWWHFTPLSPASIGCCYCGERIVIIYLQHVLFIDRERDRSTRMGRLGKSAWQRLNSSRKFIRSWCLMSWPIITTSLRWTRQPSSHTFHTVSEHTLNYNFQYLSGHYVELWHTTHTLIYEMVCALRTRLAHSTQQMNRRNRMRSSATAGRNLVSIYLQITYILFDTTSMHSAHFTPCMCGLLFRCSTVSGMANENK